MKKINFIVLSFIAIACAFFQTCSHKKNSEELINQESAQLNQFLDSIFTVMVERDPVRMGFLGINKRQDEWTDLSEKNREEEINLFQQQLKVCTTRFQLKNLNPSAQISYKLFVYDLNAKLKAYHYEYQNPNSTFYNNRFYLINHMNGYHTEVVAFLINHHLIKTKQDAENYIKRLIGIDSLFSQLISISSLREKQGIIPPRFVFPMVVTDCKNILTGKPFDQSKKDSPLLEDFKKKINELNGLSIVEKNELQKQAENALLKNVKPAYKHLMTYWKELEKKSTNDDGIWKIPNGDKNYSWFLHVFNSTDLTADQIHEIGLKEVARIQEEMKVIMKKVNFKNSNLKDFFQFMRTDKRFYYSNDEKGRKAYIAQAIAIIDTMQNQLDKLFYTKPQAKLIVKAVEAFREQSSAGAFYEVPALDGSRPGIYYINLYDIRESPIYQMEALAYHEGIPGHHMQLAISQELKGIPQFRRVREEDDAYMEGWALYTEQLGKEIGFYQDPYSDFGRLAMEIFRASRLVVDTGIHSKRWTREQAVQYMLENTPLTEGDIRKEIGRYTVWPGQATAYMIGKLKIVELREKAKKELKDKFDIRAFHDAVLTNGPMPLNLLEEVVDQYINDTNKK